MADEDFEDDDEDDEAPTCQGPDPAPRAPGFALPAGACDSQGHIIAPIAAFPLSPLRAYTPPDAPLAQYRQMLATLGLQRGVLVQPSAYGSDNRCLFQALAAHRNTLRGVAVVPPETPDDELQRIAHLGVRGIRFNLYFAGGIALDHLELLAERIEPLHWHLQLLVGGERLPELAPRLAKLPVDIVIEHFGFVQAADGVDHPGFRALLGLIEGGRCWVKLTAPNRISAQGPPYDDVAPFAKALIAADPTRLLWGSDWPHVAVDGKMPNDGTLLDLLAEWAPDERLRRLILVENPARLYGFGE